MRRLAVLFVVALVLSAGWVAACLDTTPLLPDAPPPSDASVPDVTIPTFDDASSDGQEKPEVDPRPPCEQCVESPDQPGPGCATELEACFALPQCKEVYICAVVSGCLNAPTRKEISTCGLPCIQDSGLTSTQQPAAQALFAVLSCAFGACAGVCGGDAGTD